MRIRPAVLGIVIVVFIFGGIGLSGLMNWWATTESKIPATYTSGAFEGQYDPSDIRGSYTFGDVSNLFEVPLDVLGEAFGLKEETDLANLKCNKLESLYDNFEVEIGTDSVRVFVALFKGLPIELEDTYLPASATSILKESGTLTAEQIAYLDSHQVVLNSDNRVTAVSSTEPAHTSEQGQQSGSGTSQTEEEHGDKQVRGSTTFKELLEWGLSMESIEKVFGKKVNNVEMSMKKFCEENGMEFSQVKDRLQKLADDLKSE